MKHIWVVESSGGRKWRVAGHFGPHTFFFKKPAVKYLALQKANSPGLKWRVAKYVRGEK
jgi:hypothetical protein